MEEGKNRLLQMDSYLLGASVSEATEKREAHERLLAVLYSRGYRPNDSEYEDIVTIQRNVEHLRADLTQPAKLINK